MYSTYYVPFPGQPRSGEMTHDDLPAAIAAWLADIRSLPECGGGGAVLIDTSDGARFVWIEHVEGGFVSAGGAWEDDICHAARLAAEDGETLTPQAAAGIINR